MSLDLDEQYLDETGAITPALLGEAQPLPTATRRKLVEDLEGYDPPLDWRDDEAFYAWLRDHYVMHGTGFVDAALRRQRGNNLRRTLRSSAIAWASHEFVRRGLDAPDEEDLLEDARSQGVPEVAALLEWLLTLGRGEAVAADCTGAEDEDAEQETATEPEASAPQDGLTPAGTIAAARTLLDRLEAEPDLEALLILDETVRRIAADLDSAERARAVAARSVAERAAAVAALLAAAGALSEMRRAMIEPVAIAPDATVADIAAATELLKALIAAETGVETAKAILAGHTRLGPARRAAVDALHAAENEAEQALEATAEVLAPIRPTTSVSEVAPVEPKTEVDPALAPEAPHEASAARKPAHTLLFDEAVPPGLLTEEPGEPVEIASPVRDAFEFSDESIGSDVLADEDVAPDRAVLAPVDAWDEWIARAIDADRIGLATHLANARQIAGADMPHASWPAPVIEAALVGRSIEAHADRAANRYATLEPALSECARTLHIADDRGYGLALALLAGALRASLVAPYSGNYAIEALPAGGPLTAFHGLIDFAQRGPQLSLSAIRDLAPAKERQVRERELAAALGELGRWYEAARTRTLPYQPATWMWQRELVTPAGKIGRPIRAILEGHANARALAQELAAELRDAPGEMLDGAFDEQLTRSKAIRLDGIARERCLALFEEARERIDAWLRVGVAGREASDRLERPRAELLVALRAAEAPLQELRAAGGSTGRGATLLGRSVADLVALIEAPEREVIFFGQVLDSEIALLADFPLNGRTRFSAGIDDVEPLREAAAATLPAGVPSWRQAFDRALDIGAVSVAERIRPMLADAGEEETHRIAASAIGQRREIEARRSQLRDRLDDLQTASSAETDNRVTEFEATLVSLTEVSVDELPRDDVGVVGAIGDFPTLRRRLHAFERELEEQRRVVASDLERRIAAAEQGKAPLRDCRVLLERGDLGTLAEDLAQIEKHGPDAASVRPKDLLAPLQRFTDQVLGAGTRPVDVRELVEPARSGRRHDPFRFDELPAPERNAAAALIDAWNGFKRAAQTQAKELDRPLLALLGAIGFSGAKVARQTAWRGARRFEVKTDPIRSASDCIIPAFGSQAGGNYTILVAPQGTLVKCLQGFDELPTQLIAFATEWLTANDRELFLKRARQRGTASIALLDDAGLGALAATQGRGLRHFFDLAVPFGAAHPYADASLADAPPSLEMFFGRELELQQLEDAQGSCLVYGGRQLGKTALLKQIQLRNEANPDLAVVYLSIQPVGSSVPSAESWNLLGQQLHDARILPKLLRGQQDVCAAIREWLAAVPSRRLMMLLDEADNFLESEINSDFAIITGMRRLMEETSRRAKFVFAGLHNVQRFVRMPNSPMLHLGTPVQIGPLLGRDRAAARRMVFEPMAAAGIGFRESTDAHHMLSLVGYYPSLLQTFGKTILARVDREMARGETTQLPKLLERKDITDSFYDTEFRNQLVEKFRATLQLDLRYELITYTVCYRVDEDRRSNVTSVGYTETEIRRLALEFWPQGFTATRSAETFEALLDEMVGLGVLNREGERFTLRSARIAAMLGGSEQILSQLIEFGDREPVHKSDPMANHRTLRSGGYAPLPLRQEKALIDQLQAPGHTSPIVLIAGSDAVAVDDEMAEGIVSLAKAQEWPEPRRLEYRRPEELQKVIGDVRRDARHGGAKLIVCTGRWPTAAELAGISLRELRDASRPVRVLFLGGAEDIVRAETGGEADAMRAIGATVIDVQPWDREAVHHWLIRQAGEVGDDIGFAATVLDACGGFAGILAETKLPRGRINRDEILRRIADSAERLACPDFLGFADARLGAFVANVADWGDIEGFSEKDLFDIAREVDAVPEQAQALFRAGRRLGLLREIQKSGPAQFRLNPLVARAAKPAAA